MKVGIYNEPSGGGVGGAESTAAVLAEALSLAHEVEIVHHRNGLSAQQLAEVSGANLGAARLRYVEAEPFSFGVSRIPWRRYGEARAWRAGLSKPYDLFINITHGWPPFCHAQNGALIILFPLDHRPHDHLEGVNSLIKSPYHNWEWSRRIESYQVKTTISRFSQEWTRRRWGVDCQVIHPPVDTHFGRSEVSDLILSTGRFTTEGHSKKQSEMVAVFGQMKKSGLEGWSYICAGSLGQSSSDKAYFEAVERAGENCGAKVLANVERGRLKQYYERAKIFWHAAGYGEGDERPELAEHFGIATVEAMAAGCVPVVINKGGQSEVVEHAVNGFLWDTLDDLKRYTALLIGDERLRQQMAEAARARARQFSRESFVSRFLNLLALPPVPDPASPDGGHFAQARMKTFLNSRPG